MANVMHKFQLNPGHPYMYVRFDVTETVLSLHLLRKSIHLKSDKDVSKAM